MPFSSSFLLKEQKEFIFVTKKVPNWMNKLLAYNSPYKINNWKQEIVTKNNILSERNIHICFIMNVYCGSLNSYYLNLFLFFFNLDYQFPTLCLGLSIFYSNFWLSCCKKRFCLQNCLFKKLLAPLKFRPKNMFF